MAEISGELPKTPRPREAELIPGAEKEPQAFFIVDWQTRRVEKHYEEIYGLGKPESIKEATSSIGQPVKLLTGEDGERLVEALIRSTEPKEMGGEWKPEVFIRSDGKAVKVGDLGTSGIRIWETGKDSEKESPTGETAKNRQMLTIAETALLAHTLLAVLKQNGVDDSSLRDRFNDSHLGRIHEIYSDRPTEPGVGTAYERECGRLLTGGVAIV